MHMLSHPQVLLNTVSTKVDIQKVNKLIAADIIMNGSGMLCCLYGPSEGGSKYAIYTVGCIVMLYIMQVIYAEYRRDKHVLDQPFFRGFMVFIMFTGWNLYTFGFLLGPAGFNVYGWPIDVIAHSFGDLYVKNFFSFCAWRIQRNTALRIARDEKNEENEKIKLDIVSNAATGILEKRDGSLAEGEGAQDNIRRTRDIIATQEDEIAELKRQLAAFN